MPKSFFSSKDPIFNNKLDINKTINIDYSNAPRNAVIAPTATLVGAKFIDGFRNKKFSKGKLGKLAILASLLGGASGIGINESTNVKVKPKAFSFDNIIQKTEQPKINNIEDLNKLYLVKLTRTLGGGALGYTLGSLLSIGADKNSFRNMLPYLLGLGGAGLGYAYKDYKINTNNLKQLSNDISNKINSWFNKTARSNRIPYLAFNNINNSNMNINQLHNKFNKTAAAGLASAIATNNDPAKDPASRAGDMWQGALTSELGAGTGGALGLVLAQLLAKNAKPETQALAAILGALSGYAGGGILGHKASKALAANRDKKREELLNKKTASSTSLIATKPVDKALKNINLKNLAKLLGIGAGTIGLGGGAVLAAKDIKDKINLYNTHNKLMASVLGGGAGLLIGKKINEMRKSKNKLLPLILALGGGTAGLAATGGVPSLEELKNYGNFAKDELVKDTKSIYNKASSGIENLINKLKSKN